MSKHCPAGEIEREGYVRKSYRRADGTKVKGSKVSPSCVENRGAPGKGSKLIPIKDDDMLGKYGYRLKSLTEEERHEALRKAIKGEGYRAVIARLVALANVQHRTEPTYSRRAKADQEYVSDLYAKYKEKYGTQSFKKSSGGAKRRRISRKAKKSKKVSSKRKSKKGGAVKRKASSKKARRVSKKRRSLKKKKVSSKKRRSSKKKRRSSKRA